MTPACSCRETTDWSIQSGFDESSICWNCCGAVYSLADDDLIHHVAPVRNLIRAAEQGSDKVVTLCSQCYNTLARANLLVREDEEKRGTLNTFMDEEKDYGGEVAP